MKLRNRFLTMVGGVILAAGLLATSSIGARANDGDVDLFWFVGNTCGLSPAVQLVGGSGTFCFSSTNNSPVPGECLGYSSDAFPAEAWAFGCSITASGNYSNTVCGTGSASGSGTTTEPDGASESGAGFSITFAAGFGVVTGGATGVVQLLPTSPASPPACVTGFTVVGDVIFTN